MEQIALAIPAYRNPEAVSWVVESVLRQSHEDVRVFVFDDGFSVGFREVRETLRIFGDERFMYRANARNLGHLENYRRCFAAVSSFPYGMVMPADVGLLPQSLEILLACMKESHAEIAYAPAKLFKRLEEARAITSSRANASFLKKPIKTQAIPALNLLSEFFSDKNVAGEYTRFSVLGALGEGHLFHPLASLCSPYRFHGWEFQSSMFFAAGAKNITILREELRIAVTGLEKFGTAQRPKTDWTRIEPILATYETATWLLNRNSKSSSPRSPGEISHAHLKLLSHYSKVYGQHRVVARVLKIIVSLSFSNSSVLRLIFSLLVRCRSRRSPKNRDKGLGLRPN